LDFQPGRVHRPNGSAFLPKGPLAAYTTDKEVRWIRGNSADESVERRGENEADVVASYRVLQDVVEYRGALQSWFGQVKIGGHLIVIVPHAFLYERQYSLPSRWRLQQKRLYTPASLLLEVEEALVPNSYRVRWLGDLDGNYDYRQDPGSEPPGESDVALVLERLSVPTWSLDAALPTKGTVRHDTADYTFEQPRTRVEVERKAGPERIVILKLDHLGDLIMGTPALQRARSYFPNAWIDLVVGSWNVDLARDLGIADRVIAFDAFPRNSTEEEANVDAKIGLFKAQVTDAYDLAIDLRVDTDTRSLLRAVQAPIKAGIGTRARFPFLDIALPLDSTRNDAERVRDQHIDLKHFALQDSGARRHFRLHSDRDTVERDHAIVWGPYFELDPGDYIFDFYLDLEMERGSGLLKLDIAVDYGTTVAEMLVSSPRHYHLNFRIDKPRVKFEARILTVPDYPSISFNFYGGRLIKKGPGNVLHQAEYAALLIELVKLRTLDFGMLEDVAAE
jgi:hypothetical protein